MIVLKLGRGPARVFLLTGFALLALALPGAGRLSAHAKLSHSHPGSGDLVNLPPSHVDAFFEEEVLKRSGTYGLAVTDAFGNQVDNQDSALDDTDRTHMTVTLQANLPPGLYNVHWWTVSDADGDAASGDYSFTIAGS